MGENGVQKGGASVAAVCGPGGTGASTVAIALAQALGDDPRFGGLVLLADLCRRADQAVLHDAVDITPGLDELVEGHRRTKPVTDAVRGHTFVVCVRRYRLLLGLRCHRSSPTLEGHAFRAAFDGLVRAHHVVICDTDADVDDEDRDVMARTVTRTADVVFAVGLPTLTGVHSLVRVIDDLCHAGVDPDRIVPVFNRARCDTRARHDVAAALAALVATPFSAEVVFLPERPVEGALCDGARLPAALCAPLAGAFDAATADERAAPVTPPRLERVRPGTLGSRARV